MARTGTSDTLASHVYEELRAAILAGEYTPGERLMPADLRGRFGVSVSVIREALARLAEQRLVLNVYNHGFQVTPLSRKDLLDLTDIRVEIDSYALRRAIAQGDIAWESQVVAAHHTLAATPRATDQPVAAGDTWAQAHRMFHRALVLACDMPILLDFHDSLFDASELYRRLAAPLSQGHRDVPGEHREIMEAIVARDTDRATQLLEAHYRQTTSVIVDQLLAAEA